MTRQLLLPGSVIEFDGIEATVLEDLGETVKVREDQGFETEWKWEHEGRACTVVKDGAPAQRDYEQVVEALSNQIYECMDFDQFKDAVENGLIGVRQMTNEQMIQAWKSQFDELLIITDPESNPNRPSLEERL